MVNLLLIDWEWAPREKQVYIQIWIGAAAPRWSPGSVLLTVLCMDLVCGDVKGEEKKMGVFPDFPSPNRQNGAGKMGSGMAVPQLP